MTDKHLINIIVKQPFFGECYSWRDSMNKIMVTCPSCLKEKEIDSVLTAQSNQNVIYQCPHCGYERKKYSDK